MLVLAGILVCLRRVDACERDQAVFGGEVGERLNRVLISREIDLGDGVNGSAI